MILKYLSGYVPVIKDGETEEDHDFGLVVTVKCDSYQHRDMAQDHCLSPFHGGFYYHTDGEFGGDSVSCQVKSDDEHTKGYLKPLWEKGEIFQLKDELSKYKSFMIVPEGFGHGDAARSYIKVTRDRMMELLLSDANNPFYF